MRPPRTPVERLQSFLPRFCPWPTCSEHRRTAPGYRYRYRRHGSYCRRTGREVPRFRCRTCRRTFSTQSFATSYYMKRPGLLVPIAAGLVAGSAHRQIARSLGCAPSTVTRLSARLGRHAMLVQAAALAEIGSPREPVELDDFEGFEFSQDFPVSIATAVGFVSWFTYLVDAVPHARGGRITPAQARRLAARPPRDRHGGYRASTRRILEILLGKDPTHPRLELVLDAKPERLQALRPEVEAGRVAPRVVPNPLRGPKGSPRSPEAVARDAAMLALDVLHQLIRHSLAHHRRETIAFGRRVNALMERMFLFVAWRNFIKGVSERKPDPTTPGMRVGVAREPWTWRQLLSRRRFLGRETMPPVWLELYRREWLTPVLRSNTRHTLEHAV